PASDGQNVPVTWRQRKYAVQAASAGISTAATLYATAGPASTVSGVSTSESAGIVVAHARLNPSGAQIAWVTKGFTPSPTAWGHQATDQTKICGSVPRPTSVRPGWESTRRPKYRNETST